MLIPDRLAAGFITDADAQEFAQNPIVPHPGEDVTVRLRGRVVMGFVSEQPNDLAKLLMGRMTRREQVETELLVKSLRRSVDEKALDQMIPPTADHLKGWYEPVTEPSPDEVQTLGLYETLTLLGRAVVLEDGDAVKSAEAVDEAYGVVVAAQGVAPTAADTLFMRPVNPDATVYMAPVAISGPEADAPGLLQTALHSDATQRFSPVGSQDPTMKIEAVRPLE